MTSTPRLFLGALLMSCAPLAAKAGPITFAFDMPTFNAGPLVHQSVELQVTVRNDQPTLYDRVFSFADVLTLHTDLTGLVQADRPAGSSTLISTDDTGTPTLELSPQEPGYVQGYGGTGGYISLTSARVAGFQVEAAGKGGAFGAWDSRTALSVGGRQASGVVLVPEPGTVALLAAGLVGVLYRRKVVVRRPTQRSGRWCRLSLDPC